MRRHKSWITATVAFKAQVGSWKDRFGHEIVSHEVHCQVPHGTRAHCSAFESKHEIIVLVLSQQQVSSGHDELKLKKLKLTKN